MCALPIYILNSASGVIREKVDQVLGDTCLLYTSPIACYEEDLKSYSVAWHWHEEFEYILAVKGPLAVDVSKARLVLQTGQGVFVNSGVFHEMCIRDS